MGTWTKKRVRKLNIATHRDLGYFFTALIIVYCISGLALNHVDDWNPDFVIEKENIHLKRHYKRTEINENRIRFFNNLVGEDSYKVFDFPTNDQVKIYYKDASLHIYLDQKKGIYERISKRHLFYEADVIHRNSLKGWKWISDIFAIGLIVLTVTGLFVLKGKHGISGRGKWLIAAGFFPPLIAIIIYAFI